MGLLLKYNTHVSVTCLFWSAVEILLVIISNVTLYSLWCQHSEGLYYLDG